MKYGLSISLASCISAKVMKISRVATQVTAARGLMLKTCCRQEHKRSCYRTIVVQLNQKVQSNQKVSV